MQLRLIAVSLVSTTAVAGIALVSGFPSGPAQAGPELASALRASTARTGTISARAAQKADLAGAQANQGVITGVVDGAGGRPLIGACVVASGPAGTTGTMTRVGGRYVLPALRPGGYTLHYSACGAGGGYVDQWSGGAAWPQHASLVTVAAGQVKQVSRVTLRSTAPPSGATFRVSPGAAGSAQFPMTVSPPTGASATITASTGGIAGTVTGNGKPLKGICVNAFGPGRGTVLTSKTGKFQIGGLRPGRYIVDFIPYIYCGKNTGNWLLQWYRGITSPQEPRHPVLVPVTAGKVTHGINAAMVRGGEITGTARSQAGKALGGVCVFAQGLVGRINVGYVALSGKNGSYALHSLFKGKYFVEFSPCEVKGNYAPQWYKNSANQAHAKAIMITGAQVISHVNAALPPGGIISGVVRAKATNAPLGKICVYARPLRGPGFFAGARTAANGSYKLTRLITGKYLLQFSRYCGNTGNYLAVQRVVSVRTGHTLVADAFLPPGAIASGVVTDPHGNPVRGVCVAVYGRNSYNSAISAADGTYSVNALPTGSYTVEFSGGCGNADSYATQYYHEQANLASANLVALTAGKTTSGIDDTLQPGGTITGQVTDGAGNPLNRICVSVVNVSAVSFGYPFDIQFTKNGTYVAKNLTPGLYGVNFGCFFGSRSQAPQWFMSQPGSGSADLVSAPGGVITSGVSAALTSGGFIKGMVTNSANAKLSGICVTATQAGQAIPFRKFGPFRVTNKGAYDVGPLMPGKYDVQFEDCFRDRYAAQWYRVRGSDSEQAATPVTVRSGGTTSGIDVVMTAGGSIAGRVTDSSLRPLPRICVTATDAATQTVRYAQTDAAGHYTMPSLTTGEYQVTFADCNFRRHVQAGTGVRSVRVTAPHAALVNEKLAQAGIISGTVLGGSAATPQYGVCVVAVPVSPGDAIGSTATGSHGNYRLTDLAPGKYQVYFGDPFCAFYGSGYAPQWYNNQSAQAAATTVTVAPGGDVSDISATLGSDGAISGVVKAHPHAPVAGECVTAVPVNPTPDPLNGDTLNNAIAVTAADGSYTLVGLLPGQYQVEFSTGCGDTGFRAQWWKDAISAASATTITVSADTTTTGINAKLQH